jgi:hypothetical protein
MPPRKKKGDGLASLMGIVMIGVFAVVVAGGAGWYFMQRQAARDVDPVTHCPKDRIDHVTAVVIDLTDLVSKTQAVAIENEMGKLRSSTPKYGRLDIYTILSAAGAARDPVFSLCNPGSGADVKSDLSGNRAMENRRFEEAFGARLDMILSEALKVTPTEASPIFEAIQFAAVRSFGGELVREAQSKRLVVISDMLHHSPEFSQYRPTPPHAEFRRSQYYARIKPQLRGATVDMYVIFRDTRRNVQQKPWQDFWVAHFQEGGGTVDGWYPLQ